MKTFINILRMILGKPYGISIWASLLVLLFIFWANSYVFLPGLWFVLAEIILFLSIRGQFYYYFYKLSINKTPIILSWCGLAVAVPCFIVLGLILEFVGFNNNTDKWQNIWPIYSSVLSDEFRNPDVIPKKLKAISARDSLLELYTYRKTIVFEGDSVVVAQLENRVKSEAEFSIVMGQPSTYSVLKSSRTPSAQIDYSIHKIESTYEVAYTRWWCWNPLLWLVFGRQVDGGYYDVENVSVDGYTVYMMYNASSRGQMEPYTIYFAFSPDRTRVVFYDYIVTH